MWCATFEAGQDAPVDKSADNCPDNCPDKCPDKCPDNRVDKAVNKLWSDALRYLWPAPWTLVGLLLALLALALGARARCQDGVLEVSGGGLGRLAARSPFAAITLGHVVLASCAQQMHRLRGHERCHVRQYELWGLLFVPAYGLAGLWQQLQGRCPYRDNPFEKDAHRATGHLP